MIDGTTYPTAFGAWFWLDRTSDAWRIFTRKASVAR